MFIGFESSVNFRRLNRPVVLFRDRFLFRRSVESASSMVLFVRMRDFVVPKTIERYLGFAEHSFRAIYE